MGDRTEDWFLVGEKRGSVAVVADAEDSEVEVAGELFVVFGEAFWDGKSGVKVAS